MNAAAWFRDDQPDAVQVVSVLLRVVWGKYGPRRSREVEETRDCREEKGLEGKVGRLTLLTRREQREGCGDVRVGETQRQGQTSFV